MYGAVNRDLAGDPGRDYPVSSGRFSNCTVHVSALACCRRAISAKAGGFSARHDMQVMRKNHQEDKAMKKAHLIAALLAAICSFPLLAGPVNINTADAATLARELNGVGISKATLIVEYRDSHGDFKTADDLAKVKGIGKVTVEKNRENILLGSKKEAVKKK